MHDFINLLYNKVVSSLSNDHKDNYDAERFGQAFTNGGLKKILRQKIDSRYISKGLIGDS